MVGIQVANIWTNGPETYLSGIQDSVLFASDAGLRLYTFSRGTAGGILVWDPSNSAVGPIDQQAVAGSNGFGAAPGLALSTLDDQPVLLAYGQTGELVTCYRIAHDGSLSQPLHMAGGTGEILQLESVETSAGTFYFSTSRNEPGVTCWRDPGNGSLIQTNTLAIGATQAGQDLTGMAQISLGGQNYLLVASIQDGTLSTLRISDAGSLTLSDRINASDGLQIATPTALETVDLAGQKYALLAASGTSSISVIALADDGSMVVTDQVNDDRTTWFQSLITLTTVQLDNRVFVLAGGADDGISFMQLLPGGRLLHLASLADGLDTTMANVTSLSATARNGVIDIFVTSETNPGISHLQFDPGAPGEILYPEIGTTTSIGTVGNDVMVGNDDNNQLHGLAGDDILIDGPGSDQLWGGTGADVFIFTPDGQNDQIKDFEVGIDRIDLSALGRAYSISAFKITQTNDGANINFGSEDIHIISSDGQPIDPDAFTNDMLLDLWHIPVSSAPDPEDPPINPRHIAANTLIGTSGDDTLKGTSADPAFDPASAQIYRLYHATLGRDPDLTGLIDWVGRFQTGTHTLDSAAVGFVNSAEFQSQYGGVSDGQFVTLLYNNVLERDPDPAGYANWLTQLTDQSLSRAELVIQFAQSGEFITNTRAEVLQYSQGAMQADWGDDVFRLYHATLERDPDAGGFNHWSQKLAEGLSLADTAEGFVASAEFQTRYGSTTDGEFVTLLYNNVLGRSPDAGGFTHWTEKLADQSLSRADVITRFSQSGEFVTNTLPDLIEYMRGRGTDDRIVGGTGDDLLFGGALSDVFVFDVTHQGSDQVTDLEPWDRLDFTGFGYETVADVLDDFQHTTEGTVFSSQGVQVTFIDTDLAMIDGGMLWFA